MTITIDHHVDGDDDDDIDSDNDDDDDDDDDDNVVCVMVAVQHVLYCVQSRLSHLQQLQQKTEMELLDAQMFSASVENELDDEDANGIVWYIISPVDYWMLSNAYTACTSACFYSLFIMEFSYHFTMQYNICLCVICIRIHVHETYYMLDINLHSCAITSPVQNIV